MGGDAEPVKPSVAELSVKVLNVAPSATVTDVFHHFEHAGTISSINLRPGDNGSAGEAYVTFTEKKAVETAMLLSDSSMKGSVVSVTSAEGDYEPPPHSKFFSIPTPQAPPEPEGAVKVTGLAPSTSPKQIQEFLSYAGHISSIEWKADSCEAYVSFLEKKAIDTALLLTDAKLNGNIVTITPAPADYKPSSDAIFFPSEPENTGSPAIKALKQAEAAMRKLFESTVALGAGALSATATKAREIDEKHQFTRVASTKATELKSSAAAAVTDIQKKLAQAPLVISKSVAAGTEQVSQSITNVDKQYHVTEKAQGVFAAAEQRLNDVSNYLLQNKLVSQGREMIVGTAAKVSEVVEGGPSTTAVQVVDEAEKGKQQDSDGLQAVSQEGPEVADGKGKPGAHGETKEEATAPAEATAQVSATANAPKLDTEPPASTKHTMSSSAPPGPSKKDPAEDVPVF